MSRERDSYEGVGRAIRQAVAVANAEGITGADRAVLLAVIALVCSYSRLTDRCTTGQVAVAAGLWSGDAADCPHSTRRNAARRLAKLARLGAVVYEPTHGRGRVPVLGLPPARKRVKPAQKGGPLDPLSGQERGSSQPEKGVEPARKGGPLDPPPEEVSEKNPEGRALARAREAPTPNPEPSVERFAALVTTPAHGLDPQEIERAWDGLKDLGEPALRRALYGIEARGRTFTYPRQAADAIRRHLGVSTTNGRRPAPADDYADRPRVARPDTCGKCVSSHVEAKDGAYAPCPTCHPQARAQP